MIIENVHLSYSSRVRFWEQYGIRIENVSSYGEGESKAWFGYASICGIRLLVSAWGESTPENWEVECLDAKKGVLGTVDGINKAAAEHAQLLAYQDKAKALVEPIKANIEAQVAAFRAKLEETHAVALGIAELVEEDLKAQKIEPEAATITTWQGKEGQSKSFANGAIALREYSRIQHFDEAKATEYALEHLKAAVTVDKAKFEKAVSAGIINPAADIIQFGKSYGIAITRAKLPAIEQDVEATVLLTAPAEAD